MPMVRSQLQSLESMPVPELRARYAEVFGEPTNSGNRRWLVRRLAWRLQALAEGDLSERAKRRAAELARDADVRLRPPAIDELPARGLSVTGTLRPADPRRPAPGTVLRRVYKGVAHEVSVLPSGFEHEGKVYRSLTAVATAITGSHWNGNLFFGLAESKRDKRPAKENA